MTAGGGPSGSTRFMEDQFNLERFVAAQEDEIDDVRRELKNGRKTGHWIWFIFPQLRGLGRSGMANHYGISSKAEAAAYLRHPVLGPRLIECTELVNSLEGRPIQSIFGEIDAMKFRSSMTLFAEADPEAGAFTKALDKYFGSQRDSLTLDLLG